MKPWTIAALGSLLALSTTWTSPALAQTQLTLRGEAGVGVMLSSYQRDTLGLTEISPSAAGRVGFRVLDWLALQVGAEWSYFPSDGESASQVAFVGGVRLEPRLGETGRLFVDVNGGAARTGDVFRPTLSAGLGIEFQVAPWLGLGPFVRYGHTFAGSNDVPGDAQFVWGGLSVAIAAPSQVAVTVTTEPTDTDGDGVIDDEDGCPTAPAGSRPDPARPGCPSRDSDGDGVPDETDRCPTEAAGDEPDPGRPGCPLTDSDGDGVPDHEDRCPDEPRGESEDPSRVGCPAPDGDRDTVPDHEDACPDEPGAPATDPERNGCPSLARVTGDRIEALEPIFFANNSARILARSRQTLESIAEVLRARPQMQLSIEGHTDDTGDADYNMRLSQQRAESVQNALVRLGIARGRLSAQGFGQTRPAVEGDDAEARARNRRVELRIVQQ